VVGLRFGVIVALARVCRSTQGADRKYEAKMAGGGSDVQMADAAGEASSGAIGAWGPAGRARSEASVDSGLLQDGSSADNGGDTRGGGLPAENPDRAEDKAAELPLIEGEWPSPFRRLYFSPRSVGTQHGDPVIKNDAYMVADTNNRRVTLVCAEKGHRGHPGGFQ